MVIKTGGRRPLQNLRRLWTAVHLGGMELLLHEPGRRALLHAHLLLNLLLLLLALRRAAAFTLIFLFTVGNVGE